MKGIKKLLVLSIILTSCFGCQKEEERSKFSIQTLTPGTVGYQLNAQNIIINNGLKGREFYGTFGTYLSQDTLYFYGFNEDRHKIDVLVLSEDKKGLVREIHLEKEGPNGIERLTGIKVLEKNRIILVEEHYIKTIDENGNVKERIKLPQTDYRYNTEFEIQPHYSAAMNALYFRLNNVVISSYVNPQAYYKTKAFGQVSLSTKEATPLNIDYPKKYQEAYYGYFENPSIRGNGDNLIYSFPADHLIYSYNLNEQKTTVYNAKPLHAPQDTPKLDWSDSNNEGKKMTHFLKNQVFAVNFMMTPNLIVRLYRSPPPTWPIAPENILKQKDCYLSILDLTNGNYSDIQLSTNNIFLEKAFVNNNELWIPYFVEGLEGQIKFLKIDINETTDE